MEEQPIPVNLEDLYKMIGEREVVRYLQQKRIVELMTENEQLRQKSSEHATAANASGTS